MKCAQINKLLPVYLENELSWQEKMEVEAHLKTCARCAADLDNFKKISLLLSSMPQLEINPSLQARLYSIPTQIKLQPSRKLGLLDFFLKPSAQPALAAAVILLLFLSFFTLHPDGRYLGYSLKGKINFSLGQLEKTIAKVEGFPGYWPLVRRSIAHSLKNIVQGPS